MTTEKHLELIIPASLWPDTQTREAIWCDLPLPALAHLYGKAHKKRSGIVGLEGHLAQHLGLDQLQMAPLLLSSQSGEFASGYWLCVDPITLRVDRDHLTILGEPFLQVTQQEADALVAALNALYADDGYCFMASSPRRWFVRLPHNPQLQFTPIKKALGQNMNAVLPVGEGALKFNALLNEMQMLLYAHAVNDARDEAGLPLINSVWLWGGGEYPAVTPNRPSKAIYGADELVQALSGQSIAPMQLADLPALHAVVVLHDLEMHTIYGAGYEWQQVWQRWESAWFAPALAALKSGAVDRITLHFSDVAEQCVITKSDLWRFWRKTDLPRHLNFQVD